MRAFLKRGLLAVLAAVSSFGPAMAQTGTNPVHVALTAQRVQVVNGHETLVAADQAKPGETLVYRVTCSNDGRETVKSVMATLPIPSGLEYLPRTAAPAVVQASLDGRTFAPVPLVRRTRDANGREVVVEVPASEYRFLRWSVGTLAPKASRTVTARARVAPAQVAALTR
ncbi:MAG: hypothetical protein U0704_02515 [Candidatus Eisenbacteria bacterium]